MESKTGRGDSPPIIFLSSNLNKYEENNLSLVESLQLLDLSTGSVVTSNTCAVKGDGLEVVCEPVISDGHLPEGPLPPEEPLPSEELLTVGSCHKVSSSHVQHSNGEAVFEHVDMTESLRMAGSLHSVSQSCSEHSKGPESVESMGVMNMTASTSRASGGVWNAAPLAMFSEQGESLLHAHLRDIQRSWNMCMDSLSHISDLVFFSDSSVDGVVGYADKEEHNCATASLAFPLRAGLSETRISILSSMEEWREVCAGTSRDRNVAKSSDSVVREPPADLLFRRGYAGGVMQQRKLKCNAHGSSVDIPCDLSDWNQISQIDGDEKGLPFKAVRTERQSGHEETSKAESENVSDSQSTYIERHEEAADLSISVYPASHGSGSVQGRSLFLEHMCDMHRSWLLIKFSFWNMWSTEHHHLDVSPHDSGIRGLAHANRDDSSGSLLQAHLQDLITSWHVLTKSFRPFWFLTAVRTRNVDSHFQEIVNESSLLLNQYEDILEECREVSSQFFSEISASESIHQQTEQATFIERNIPSTSTAAENRVRPVDYPIGRNQQLEQSARQHLSTFLCFFMHHLQDLIMAWLDVLHELGRLWFMEERNLAGHYEGTDAVVLGNRTGSILFEHIGDMRRTWSLACLRFWQLWFCRESVPVIGQAYHGRFGHTIARHRQVTPRRSRGYLFRDQPWLAGFEHQELCSTKWLPELARLLMALLSPSLLRGLSCNRVSGRRKVEEDCQRQSISNRLRNVRQAGYTCLVLRPLSAGRNTSAWLAQVQMLPAMWIARLRESRTIWIEGLPGTWVARLREARILWVDRVQLQLPNSGLRMSHTASSFYEKLSAIGMFFREKLSTLCFISKHHSTTLLVVLRRKMPETGTYLYHRMQALKNACSVQVFALRESALVVWCSAYVQEFCNLLKSVGELCWSWFSRRFPGISSALRSRWLLAVQFCKLYPSSMLGHSGRSLGTVVPVEFCSCCQDMLSCDKNCSMADDILFVCQEPRVQALVTALLFAVLVLTEVLAASGLPALCVRSSEALPPMEEMVADTTLSQSVLSSLRDMTAQHV